MKHLDRHCREVLQLTKLTAKATKEIISSAQKVNFSQYQNPSQTAAALHQTDAHKPQLVFRRRVYFVSLHTHTHTHTLMHIYRVKSLDIRYLTCCF